MSVPITEASVESAIAIVLKVSMLMAGAAGAQALFARRTSAATRHLIWVLAIAASLLMPVFAVVLPRWSVAIPVTTSIASRIAPSDQPILPAETTTGAGPALLLEAAPADAAGGGERDAIGTAGSPVLWLALVPMVYVAGTFVLLLRLLVERSSTQRLVRQAVDVQDPAWTNLMEDCRQLMGVRRPVRLLRSRERTMPMAAGIRHPAILIPAIADTWVEERRRAVLLHELAHVARRDCLTQMIAAVASIVYWMHPGVWWIGRRLRVERELACDDRVLTVGTSGRDYAEHLLDLAYTLGGGRAPALAVSMARREQLEGRLLAVLDAARNRATPALGSTVAAVAIASALLMPLAAAGPSQRSSSPEAITGSATASGREGTGEPQAPAVAANAPGQETLGGTWEIRPSDSDGIVRLTIAEDDHSSHVTTISVGRLEGLPPALLTGRGGPAQFRTRRDAGTFVFAGAFWSGVGAGTYQFMPSTSFRDELVTRGFPRPSPGELHVLARGDIGLAYLDELKAQGYASPVLTDLVHAAAHGVDVDYLREMGRAGYRLGRLEGLVTLRDHGVSPQYIRELGARGLTGLTAVDLTRARDHGVNARYIDELQGLGYRRLSLDSLISARDHGISADYARDVRALGMSLTLVELTTARDHGVSGEYIRELSALGYGVLSLSDLITARDHGISPEYVRDLRGLGYRLTLAELTAARDHGVSKEYIAALAALGFTQLPLETVMQLRDHGVTPEYVKQLKTLGHDRLDPDAIIRMRDQGVGAPLTAERLRAGVRRFVDRLLGYTQ